MSDLKQKWHAVDFDGTLAFYVEGGWKDFDPSKVGDPIQPMCDRVRKWLEIGDGVVILTARVHPSKENEASIARKAIEDFCMIEFGVTLEVTHEKHPKFHDFWDDKAVRVVRNMGTISDGKDVDDLLASGVDGIGEYLCGK